MIITEAYLRNIIKQELRIVLKEAIVDTPSDKLSDIFDDNGVMKKEVTDTIKDGIQKLQKFLDTKNLKISKAFVVGAAVTYQYSPTSDIDTSVIIPNMKDEQWGEIDSWMEKNLNYPNWSVNGSSRPFQFKATTTDMEFKHADAAYDPYQNKWLKEPSAEKTKQQYSSVISDPKSKERKMYAFVEKHLQPSLKQLFDALSSNNLQENVSDRIKKLMIDAFKRYEVMKRKRGSAYKEEPNQTGRISQNWGTGNVLYKFMDREGYNEVYGYLKKAIKSNFQNVDQNFINNLKEKLQHVLSSEHGYSSN